MLPLDERPPDDPPPKPPEGRLGAEGRLLLPPLLPPERGTLGELGVERGTLGVDRGTLGVVLGALGAGIG